MSQHTPEQVEEAASICAESFSPLYARMLIAYAAILRQQAARADDRQKEAIKLAGILDGLGEGGYTLDGLYENDQADGDCFVARAADLLRELAALAQNTQGVVGDLVNLRDEAGALCNRMGDRIADLEAQNTQGDGECAKCGAPTDPECGHVGECHAERARVPR